VESALCPQAVHKAGDNSLCPNSAKRDQPARCKRRRGNSGSQLRQGQPMPPKGSASLLGDPARELVGRVEGCSDDQHLIGRDTAFQPSERSLDSALVHGRDDGSRVHGEIVSCPHKPTTSAYCEGGTLARGRSNTCSLTTAVWLSAIA
jgi:hypothetical protein